MLAFIPTLTSFVTEEADDYFCPVKGRTQGGGGALPQR